MAVTSLCWNPLYKDLFAVGHGSCESGHWGTMEGSCDPPSLTLHTLTHPHTHTLHTLTYTQMTLRARVLVWFVSILSRTRLTLSEL